MGTVGRVVTTKIEIAWDGTNYVDESAYFVSARGEFRIAAPGSSILSPRGTVDAATIVLRNPDEVSTGRRFSPLNTSGALYSMIANGGAYHRPVKISISVNGASYVRVFTGVIKIPREGTPTPKSDATVDIDCRSNDELMLQLKTSTTLSAFVDNHNNGVTEGDIITQMLANPPMSLSSGQYAVDGGKFGIPWAWLDDESILDDLWQLAAACGGRLYTDPEGIVRYENMSHWLGHSTSSETLTRASYTALQIRYDDSELYSEVTVEASPRAIEGESVLWEPEDEILVPAGGTRTITAKLRQPAYSISSYAWTARTSGGINITPSVTLDYTEYAQRVILTWTSVSAYACEIAHAQIIGRSVNGAPTIEETRTSTDAFWTYRKPRDRSVRGNVYVQSRSQAKTLAEYLRDAQETPRLVYSLSGLQGSPLRRLGDRVTINDTAIMSAARDAFVTRIGWTISDSGYQQAIEAIDAEAVYGRAPGDYLIIGTDALCSDAVLFY